MDEATTTDLSGHPKLVMTAMPKVHHDWDRTVFSPAIRSKPCANILNSADVMGWMQTASQ